MRSGTIWSLVLGSSALWLLGLQWVSRSRRLPLGLLVFGFLAGLATAPCVIFVTTMLRVVGFVTVLPNSESPWLGGFGFFFLSFALLEEVGLWAFCTAVLHSLQVQLSPALATRFAASAALGFAALENGRYLISLSLEGGGQALREHTGLILVGRFVLGVLLHLTCGLFWGPYLQQGGGGARRLLVGMLGGMTVHALYDVLILKDHLGWACFVLALACTGTIQQQSELTRTSGRSS